MDALARVTTYFPFQSLTCFWVVSNIVINNGQCDSSTQSLIIALIVIFAVFTVVASFTDSYCASNNQNYVVLLIPCYGPVCLSLPTDMDKDRVYEHFYLKVRDYIRALIALIAFLLIVLFINPIASCLYPSEETSGSSRLSPSIIRTIPVVVALITGLLMVCLGPPRQSLGFMNVTPTCPPLEKQMGDNPIYADGRPPVSQSMAQYPRPAASIPEGDEEEDGYQPNPGRSMNMGGHSQVYGNGPTSQSMPHGNSTPNSSQYGLPRQSSHANHGYSPQQAKTFAVRDSSRASGTGYDH